MQHARTHDAAYPECGPPHSRMPAVFLVSWRLQVLSTRVLASRVASASNPRRIISLLFKTSALAPSTQLISYGLVVSVLAVAAGHASRRTSSRVSIEICESVPYSVLGQGLLPQAVAILPSALGQCVIMMQTDSGSTAVPSATAAKN